MNYKSVNRLIQQDKSHWVGTGFHVNQYFPRATGLSFLEDFSPFVLLDYNAPTKFPGSELFKGIGPHPHRGLETVTFVFEGSLRHGDNVGNDGVIHKGDIQWMTAGEGILHKEFHEEEWAKNDRTFHIIQLWVNLPAKDKLTKPSYQSISKEEMGVLKEDDYKIIVYAGKVLDTEGPADTFSPMDIFKVDLKKEAELEIPLKENYNSGFLVLKGSVELSDGQVFNERDFVVFNKDGEGIFLKGLKEENEVFFLSGDPLNEPIVAGGPFVMNTREELRQAAEDYKNGWFGSEDF